MWRMYLGSLQCFDSSMTPGSPGLGVQFFPFSETIPDTKKPATINQPSPDRPGAGFSMVSIRPQGLDLAKSNRYQNLCSGAAAGACFDTDKFDPW